MEFIHAWIGSDNAPIEWWQMVIRGIVIFIYLLVLVRFTGPRAFGRSTAFDLVLAVLLGSALSRCLTGNAPFVPTLSAAAALALLHVLLARLSLLSPRLGHLVKGQEIPVMRGGTLLPDALRRALLTEHDMRESLRQDTNSNDLGNVDSAFLERSGKISFVLKS